jgi:hypothetical protein
MLAAKEKFLRKCPPPGQGPNLPSITFRFEGTKTCQYHHEVQSLAEAIHSHKNA